MSSPYTSVAIANFNASPPSDDGSQVESNQAEWAKHVDKLAQPLKTAIEGVNTNVAAAFTSIYGVTAAETAAGVTPTNCQFLPGNIFRYGADPTGVSDSTTAIQNAIDANEDVFFPTGTYLHTGLTLPGRRNLIGTNAKTAQSFY